MAITAKQVKELREMTGAGMMDCKKALGQTDGDMDKAVEWLRENGLAKAAKKSGRIAAEGIVAVDVSEDGKTASKVLISFYVTYVTAHCIANYLFMAGLLLYLLKLRLYKSKCISFSLVNYIYLICCCITEYIEVVSEKIHLDAGFFRIHRLHAELL